jgi:gliding motility-associated-like protein
MRKFYFILFFLTAGVSAFASHYRAGEITYRWVGPQNQYHITITTYTNTQNTVADDQSVTVRFGDGSPDGNAGRTNGSGNGVMIAPFFRKNIYEIDHSYPGPGNYTISIEQPNRKAGILNMDDPLNTPFYIQTTLIINAFLGHNTSPVLLYPPLDSACIGSCFTHNPLAYDPDGDSLSYTLFNCLSVGGSVAQGYYVPQGVTVNVLTGDLTWCSPQPNGNFYPQCYNFAMVIHEWRLEKITGIWYEVGKVERDLEVDVFNNCNDQPPTITANDACVQAGQVVTINVSATDPDSTDLLTLSAAGGPFTLIPPPVFTTPFQPQPIPATGTLTWNTTCDLVRKFPYQVQFKATDNAQPVNLSGFKSVFIRVIAPAPLNLHGSDTCNTVILNWDAETCSPVSNPLKGYYIYRSTNCRAWNPSACENGVPSYTGYTLIGTSTLPIFIDAGLSNGINYSYRVTAYYFDGAESYSSNPVCITLRQAVPILTNVDVINTGANNDINVKWVKPIAGANGLDTIRHGGPYRYELWRGQGYNGIPNILVTTFNSPTFSGLSTTSYLNAGLNTASNPYFYRLDFYSNDTMVCSNQLASSVYLDLTPSDNQLTLNWNFNVPWSNYSYEVYRSVFSQPFVLIATTTTATYVDAGLVNGRTYCYKIKAIGKYSDPTLPAPLINWSEEKCGVPIDLIPPCAPSLSIASDCEAGINHLSWNNPNLSCADDVVAYNIFYTPTVDGDYQFLGTVTDANIITFLHDSLTSVAGCYVIAAVDSFNNQSVFSNKACVDNCPEYELPNVFTPNGDGVNDYFIPFPYRYVKDIDLKIFNRWGQVVFTSTDPDIRWDGKNFQSKTLCSDGVYYFTCVVNEIRLEGIQPRTLNGFVQILSGK